MGQTVVEVQKRGSSYEFIGKIGTTEIGEGYCR